MDELVYLALLNIKNGALISRAMLVDLTFELARSRQTFAPPSACVAAVNRVFRNLLRDRELKRTGPGKYLLIVSNEHLIQAHLSGHEMTAEMTFLSSHPLHETSANQTLRPASPLPQNARDWVAHQSILCVDDETKQRLLDGQDDAL